MECTLVPGDLVTLREPITPMPPYVAPVMGQIYTVRRVYATGADIGVCVEEFSSGDGIWGKDIGWKWQVFRKVPRPDIGALRRLLLPRPEFV
jgi:hypothetical protein